MSAITELTLPDPILFERTFDAVPGADLTFEDVHYVQVGPDSVRYVCFVWSSGCGVEAFESAVDADPTLLEWSRLAAFDDRRLYRLVTTDFSEVEDPLVYPLYREHDVTAIETRRTASGLHLRARVPSRDALRAFRSDLLDRGARPQVTKLRQELPRQTEGNGAGFPAHDLTEKQREALVLAVERGYFETPKAITLGELAAEFGVTPQTLSRHLRVAVETLAERAVESMADGRVETESA